MEKLKIFEGFAGIGAASKAIEKLGILHELVGFSEIDKYAVKSFCAIHNVNEKLNYGDVCLIDETKLPDFDLYTFGSPCQDFSVAGKQKGATWTCKDCGHGYNPLDVHYSERDSCPNCNSTNINKTRSSLVVEALRIIRHKKPKYLLMENVKNLIGNKFKPSFDKIIAELQEYGYNIYWEVLNAKNFGVPQNRERIFVVSIRKDIDNKGFEFPSKITLNKKLLDILDINNQTQNVSKIVSNQIDIHYENKIKISKKYPITIITEIRPSRCSISTEGISPCLVAKMGTGGNNVPIIAEWKRPFTVEECYALMGFDKIDYNKINKLNIAKTHLYQQIGNSIVVNILEYIFKNLFKEYI